MTNYYENLDNILAVYRLSYTKARSMNEFVEAAHLVECQHGAHPPKAKLTDFVSFMPSHKGIISEQNVEMQAKRYCDKWVPLLEMAMAQWRDDNQTDYHKI